jgi:hypothetical protein
LRILFFALYLAILLKGFTFKQVNAYKIHLGIAAEVDLISIDLFKCETFQEYSQIKSEKKYSQNTLNFWIFGIFRVF